MVFAPSVSVTSARKLPERSGCAAVPLMSTRVSGVIESTRPMTTAVVRFVRLSAAGEVRMSPPVALSRVITTEERPMFPAASRAVTTISFSP